MRALWDAHAAVGASPPRLGGVPGATDGTVLTSRGGIPTVVYGPGGKWIAHQADEFVEVADLLAHADVYVEAASRFLGHGRAVTAGRRNALTDVAGIKVGQYQRRGRGWLTGTTVVLPPPGTVGGVDVRGGGPGTRETDLLDPTNLVQRVDAICLTGGSAYGLAAADRRRRLAGRAGPGPADRFAAPPRGADRAGRGAVRPRPRRALRRPPRRRLRLPRPPPPPPPAPSGRAPWGPGRVPTPAASRAGWERRASCSTTAITVAALVAANPGGSPVDPRTGELWGARYGLPGEFDHLRRPSRAEARAYVEDPPMRPPLNTTLAIVATDARLDKSECSRMALTAHDGMARAISPIHLYTDGDVAFALATGEREVPEVRRDGGHIRPTDTRPGQLGLVFAAAADCVTRAIVHAVLAATSAGGLSSYADRFPSAFRH